MNESGPTAIPGLDHRVRVWKLKGLGFHLKSRARSSVLSRF